MDMQDCLIRSDSMDWNAGDGKRTWNRSLPPTDFTTSTLTRNWNRVRRACSIRREGHVVGPVGLDVEKSKNLVERCGERCVIRCSYFFYSI